MSKLNRKDFKELLLEWRRDFINERGPLRNFYKKEIPASLCPLSETEIVELSNFVTDLVDFSGKREELRLGKMGAGRHVYTRFNFSVPKDINILSAILRFSKNNKVKNYIGSALKEVNSGNSDPVVFFSSVGDLATGKEFEEDQEKSPYITHDLEHAVFTSSVFDSEDPDRDLEEYRNEDERRDTWNFNKDQSVDKDHFYNRTFNISWEAGQDIEKLNKIANKEDIVGFEYTDQEANAIKIELAFKKFFNEINYARAIGVGDIMPSVWAYCVSNMKNKRDLDEVNNANISEEHKEIICYILENSHDNCMETLNKFLLSQNNRIVFINTWG